MNWDAVTLQDCVDMHAMKEYAAVLNDGQILGFVLESSVAVGRQWEKDRGKPRVSIIRAQRQKVK